MASFELNCKVVFPLLAPFTMHLPSLNSDEAIAPSKTTTFTSDSFKFSNVNFTSFSSLSFIVKEAQINVFKAQVRVLEKQYGVEATEKLFEKMKEQVEEEKKRAKR